MVPLTDRNQSFSNYEPNFVPPLVQNFNVSLERQLTSTMTISFRYVGNMSTHLTSGTALNAANIFENGILDAFNTTIAGGNAPLFDQLFMGLNVGGSVVNGTTWTGSMAVRNYSTTRTYFANNSPGSFASWLNTTNALTGVSMGVFSGAPACRRTSSWSIHSTASVSMVGRLREVVVQLRSDRVPEALLEGLDDSIELHLGQDAASGRRRRRVQHVPQSPKLETGQGACRL